MKYTTRHGVLTPCLGFFTPCLGIYKEKQQEKRMQTCVNNFLRAQRVEMGDNLKLMLESICVLRPYGGFCVLSPSMGVTFSKRHALHGRECNIHTIARDITAL